MRAAASHCRFVRRAASGGGAGNAATDRPDDSRPSRPGGGEVGGGGHHLWQTLEDELDQGSCSLTQNFTVTVKKQQ